MYKIATESKSGTRTTRNTEYHDLTRAYYAAGLVAFDVPDNVAKVLIVADTDGSVVAEFSPEIARQHAWERKHGFKPISYRETGATD